MNSLHSVHSFMLLFDGHRGISLVPIIYFALHSMIVYSFWYLHVHIYILSAKFRSVNTFCPRFMPRKPWRMVWLVIQSVGSGNKSRATVHPWRTPMDIGNWSDIWPLTLTQLTVLIYRKVYRSSWSSVNFWGVPFCFSNNQRDCLLTKAARKSTYATQGCM